MFPNVGCLVQERLGIRGCPAFSVEAACSGFIYALSVADRFVASGQARRALVIGAETLSRITDYEDRATCVIFGDGAGAVVLEPADEPGVISCHLRADGRYKDLLYHPYGVSKQRGPDDTEGPYIQMRGNEVFKVAVKSLESIVDETLAANDLHKGEIDWLIPHQANQRIIEATAKRLGMSMDKVVMTLQDQGNTSAASVPMALDVAIRDGRVRAAICCCSRRSAAGSPGVRRWFVTDGAIRVKQRARIVGLICGPIVAVLVFLGLPEQYVGVGGDVVALGIEARAVAGIAAWMATWWMTEAIPVYATALIPLVVFPLTGAATIKQVAASYGHELIYLFFGGFVLALALEKCGLHRRFASTCCAQSGRDRRGSSAHSW